MPLRTGEQLLNGWTGIPADIRRILRRPLLARLYRDSIGAAAWAPHLEYELYERCWEDLARGGVDPLDLPPLLRLAAEVARGAPYPWTSTQLETAGLGSTALERYRRAGWLRVTERGDCEVWHDRLLNWTVAEALADLIRRDAGSHQIVFNLVAGLLFEPQVASGRSLAYVPFDFLWLLLRWAGERQIFEEAFRVIESRAGELLRYQLIEEHLPTLGRSVLRYLFARVETTAVDGTPFAVQPFVKAVVTLGGDSEETRRLLADPRPRVQRTALKILGRIPQPGLLDRLWDIYCRSRIDSGPWRWEHEHDWQVRNDLFDALRGCVELEPSWLVEAIEQSDPTIAPVHDLAYIVAEIGDETIWHQTKGALFTKLVTPPNEAGTGRTRPSPCPSRPAPPTPGWHRG